MEIGFGEALSPEERTQNDTQNQNGQHVGTQRIVEKVIPHRAVGNKRKNVIETEQRSAPERDHSHNPESQVGDQRDVVSYAYSQDVILAVCGRAQINSLPMDLVY